jgi:simple sugar transport system permease protein
MSSAATTAPSDERLARTSRATKLARRPEVGAVVAALVILVYFATSTAAFFTAAGISTWLESSSRFGIMAVAVALLMIGGEFDLSAGAMVGTSGLIVGVLTTHYGASIWLAILLAVLVAGGVGFLNGQLVMITRLPSFIVTLGTFFVLQGINLAVTKLITGQVAIQGLDKVSGYSQAKVLFGSNVSFGVISVRVSVLWWVLLTAVATFVLLRTPVGNWIFAVGGADTSARQVGVPVTRTKVGLFMTTALAGSLVGMLSLFSASTVQASTGVGDEFIYIICAVVGGCLLTGGYGSALGASVGALIYGMTYQGIVFAQWDNNWLKAFLGVMLLGAVLVNNWVRERGGIRR